MRLLKVKHLDPKGTALRAGLAVGDHIQSINGELITSVEHLGDLVLPDLGNMRTRSFELVYLRHGERHVASLARGDHGVMAEVESYDPRAANRDRLSVHGLGLATTIAAYFEQFLFASVIVNLEEPLKPIECVLASVGTDHIVLVKDQAVVLVPNTSILSATRISSSATLQVVIRHQVIYKGSVGVGLHIPL